MAEQLRPDIAWTRCYTGKKEFLYPFWCSRPRKKSWENVSCDAAVPPIAHSHRLKSSCEMNCGWGSNQWSQATGHGKGMILVA